MRAFALVLVFALALVATAIADDASYFTTAPPPVTQDVSSSNHFRPQAGVYEIANGGWSNNGVPSGSGVSAHPNYYERAVLVWYNMVRSAPTWFRDTFICTHLHTTTPAQSCAAVFPTGSTMTAVRPIPYSLNLNRAARAHAVDRETCASSECNGCSNQGNGLAGHSDCNGTATFTRIAKFATGASGEILWDYGSWSQYMSFPHSSVAGWICDAAMYGDGTMLTCPADSAAGHRSNIMTNGVEVGCGAIYDSTGTNTNRAVFTCNEGSSSTNPYKSLTIMSGAHVIVPFSSTSRYTYYVNYYHATDAPASASVVVDGTAYAVSLNSGLARQGTYKSIEFAYNATTPCKTYFFEIGAERYPVNGSFSTFGIGACTTDWQSTSSDSPGPIDVGSGAIRASSSTFAVVAACVMLMVIGLVQSL